MSTSTVCFFHTGSVLCEPFDELAAEYIPEADYFHLVDESVIDDLLSVGELTPSITRRICTQLSLAEQAGANVVLDTCSSTSLAVDVARQVVDVPIVKIDDPMAERAVELGDRIGVVATAESTLGPSTELVDRKTETAGVSASVESTLVDEAFEARLDGDTDRHDQLVSNRVVDLAEETDVVILAQASMSHLKAELSDRVSVPVLSSPPLAMEVIADQVAE